LLVAELGATSLAAGISDLSADLLVQHEETFDISEGPDKALERLGEVLEVLIEQSGVARASLWGVGLGVPGPVEFSTGRSISPPIMPGWHNYPIRQHLVQRFGLPVWVDNDVNLMALGELRSGRARGEQNVVYVKIALVSAPASSARASFTEGLRVAPGTSATWKCARVPRWSAAVANAAA